MSVRTYEIGDPVLIWVGDHHGDRTEGRIIHAFDHRGLRLYVVEIPTPMDDIYETRSGHFLQMIPSAGSTEYESWRGNGLAR